nr:PG0541 family transporter-associated protein [uncultured Cetobacterium sp.]
MAEKITYKRLVIYINDSQKNNLQNFLHSIKFHQYTVQTKLEGSWEIGVRHLNNHVWPGSEAVFHLLLKEKHLDYMVKNLKKFRMNLPENVVMAILVCPLDDFYHNLYTADIKFNEDELKQASENIDWL